MVVVLRMMMSKNWWEQLLQWQEVLHETQARGLCQRHCSHPQGQPAGPLQHPPSHLAWRWEVVGARFVETFFRIHWQRAKLPAKLPVEPIMKSPSSSVMGRMKASPAQVFVCTPTHSCC
jgi:hypothetical protein